MDYNWGAIQRRWFQPVPYSLHMDLQLDGHARPDPVECGRCFRERDLERRALDYFYVTAGGVLGGQKVESGARSDLGGKAHALPPSSGIPKP